MKYLIQLVILFVSINISLAQTCYIQKGEYQGADNSSYLSLLNDVSCELLNNMPQSFQDSFRVYDIDLYTLSKNMSGGVEEAWDLVKATTEFSKYHLFFGRNTEQNEKIKFVLVLPKTNEFECIDIISPNFRESIESEIEIVLNQDFSQSVFTREEAAILRLQEIVSNITSCCDVSNRSFTSGCSQCELLESSDESKLVRLHKNLDQNGFAFELVSNIYDPEFGGTPSKQKSNNIIKKRTSIPISAIVDFSDSADVDLDLFSSSFSNDFPDNSVSTYTYKFPRDCGQFEEVWALYQNDVSDYAVFIVLMNIDNDKGIVGLHFKTNYIHGGSTNRNIASNCDEICEAATGLYDISEKEDVCSNLLLSYGQRFQYKASSFFNNIFQNAKDKLYFKNFYSAKNNETLNNLNQAQTQWAYYYLAHFDYYHKKKGEWRIKAWIKARMDLCSFVIHTALDLCGLGDPFIGPLCDAGNSLLYYLEGDKTNAILSAASVAPIIGSYFASAKLGGKLATVSWSSLKYQITFGYDTYTNGIQWAGGHKILREMVKKVGNEIPFKGINYIPSTFNQVHHLIPFNMVDDLKNTAKNFIGSSRIKKLAESGWHPSDFQLNGFVIPSKFPDGSVFHAQHSSGYSTWVSNKVKDIIDNTPKSELVDAMSDFSSTLRLHIEDAWDANQSINKYFKGL